MKRLGKVIVGLVLLQLLGSNTSFSQTSEIQKADLISEFIQENYRTNWQAIPDSARKLRSISRQIGNKQYEADANKFLGVYYFRMSNQDSAIYHYTEAVRINSELGNTLEIAKSTLNIGVSYRDLGEYEKTVQYSLEAARYFDKVEDYKGMSIVYNMIGSVFYYQNRLTESVEYMEKYLEHAIKADDIFEIASANQNLGAVLSAADRDSEAVPYLIEASKIHKETGNMLGVANNSINVGTIFFNEGNYREAIPFYEQAYSSGKELGNKRVTLEAISNITRSLVNLDQNKKALEYANEGIAIAVEAGDQYMEMDILKTKSLALFNLREFEEAFLAQADFQNAKDSLINKENLEAIAELETLYETEKQQKQIAELETEKALQELTIQKSRVLQSGMGGILIVMVVIGFLWQSKVKEKELSYKVEQLEVEKEIQTERERISRDLHDNVGAQLVNIISGIELFERYKKAEKVEESEEVLTSLKEEAKSSIGQLRDTIWALNSDENTSDSFVEHVNSYLNNVEKITELTITTELNELREIYVTPTQSLNIFRIVQEATQNTIKHAGASTLEMTGREEEGKFLITILDNGTFKKTNSNGNSAGLGNMKKRAKDIGGDIVIELTEQGTKIQLSFPLQKKQKEMELV